LDFIDLGLAAALSAGIPEHQVLNFKPAEELLEWARGLRGRRNALYANPRCEWEAFVKNLKPAISPSHSL
jgi:hypothetical protein